MGKTAQRLCSPLFAILPLSLALGCWGLRMESTMFFLQFEGTPRRDARLLADAAGAFINCWIERPTLQEAVDAARASVDAEGWIVGEP
jgi:hypothetical protein